MDLLFTKRPGGLLAPADDAAVDAVRKWKVGSLLIATVRKPRNPLFHRKFFAMLNLAFDCQETYTDREVFRKAVLLRANIVEPVMLPGGELIGIPRSLSFGSMDDIEFSKVYDACLTVICREFVSGQSKDEMAANVDLLLGEFG